MCGEGGVPVRSFVSDESGDRYRVVAVPSRAYSRWCGMVILLREVIKLAQEFAQIWDFV